jgi:uncharacterized protein (DUF4415 family)
LGRTDAIEVVPFCVEELAALPDDEIDTSDIPELDEEFWQKAVLILPEGKERLTLRLDHEIVDFFKRGGRGYQTRINAVLRAYVKAQIAADARRESIQ